MTQTEALKLALEALETCGEDEQGQGFNDAYVKEAITAVEAALEAKDEPVPVAIVEVFGKDWRLDYMALPVGKHKLYAQQYTYTTPPQQEAKDEPVGLIESLKDAKPCCGQYETCWRACTPRGKFIGQRDAQRKPLTDEEIQDALEAEFLGCDAKRNWQDDLRVARAIEAAHGIKGEK
jgi:hypothetical protein